MKKSALRFKGAVNENVQAKVRAGSVDEGEEMEARVGVIGGGGREE
jgi:hypothetical protein